MIAAVVGGNTPVWYAGCALFSLPSFFFFLFPSAHGAFFLCEGFIEGGAKRGENEGNEYTTIYIDSTNQYSTEHGSAVIVSRTCCLGISD